MSSSAIPNLTWASNATATFRQDVDASCVVILHLNPAMITTILGPPQVVGAIFPCFDVNLFSSQLYINHGSSMLVAIAASGIIDGDQIANSGLEWWILGLTCPNSRSLGSLTLTLGFGLTLGLCWLDYFAHRVQTANLEVGTVAGQDQVILAFDGVHGLVTLHVDSKGGSILLGRLLLQLPQLKEIALNE